MNMRRSARLILRVVLLLVIPLMAVSVGAYYYLIGGRLVTTDNAYVKTDIIQVSADIDGRVVEVLVGDHDRVRNGDLLFRIDPQPIRIELARAEAEMHMVRTEIASLRAEHRVAERELAEALESASYYERQARRLRNLQKRGHAARTRLDSAEHDLAVARERTAVIRERIGRVLARLGGSLDTPVEEHPMYLEKVAKRDEAKLDIERTEIRSPVGGVISNLKLQRGEHIQKGRPIFSIVSQRTPWIEANLKETDLANVRVGQRATVVADAYPDFEWPALVESISPATGAEFAVLPPQNATGNWVKVVQRLPVRLRIETPKGAPPLRAGMSVHAAIDTERERPLLTVIRESWAGSRAE